MQTSKNVPRTGQTPPLHAVEAFLLILVNPNHHGRLFIDYGGPVGDHIASNAMSIAAVTLKYQLLNPEDAFRDIVESARALILAGGTMTPVSYHLENLRYLFQRTEIFNRCPISGHNYLLIFRKSVSRLFHAVM